MSVKVSRILNEAKARLSFGVLPVLIGATVLRLIVFVIAILFFELGLFFVTQNGTNAELFDTLKYTFFTLGLVTALLLCPLSVGFKKMTYDCTKGREIHISNLFYCFRSVGLTIKSVLLYLRLFVSLFPVLLLIVVTWFVVTALESLLITSLPNMLPIYLIRIGKYSIILLEIILLIIHSSRYFLAKYYLIDNDFESISESIRKSMSVMTKYQLNSISLMFYNLHLILFSILVIPLLYTLPKISTVFSVYAKNIIQIQEMSLYYMGNYDNRSII